MVFSVSYLDLRLARATSAVCLFALRTVLRVAICSLLVDSKDLSLTSCSWASASSPSLTGLRFPGVSAVTELFFLDSSSEDSMADLRKLRHPP